MKKTVGRTRVMPRAAHARAEQRRQRIRRACRRPVREPVAPPVSEETEPEAPRPAWKVREDEREALLGKLFLRVARRVDALGEKKQQRAHFPFRMAGLALTFITASLSGASALLSRKDDEAVFFETQIWRSIKRFGRAEEEKLELLRRFVRAMLDGSDHVISTGLAEFAHSHPRTIYHVYGPEAPEDQIGKE